jgi:prepilin-type processing-associated H-X9-DG protein
MTFDPDGNLVNIVFTDGNVTTSYSAAEIAEEREHYGTDVVPLHETLMYP